MQVDRMRVAAMSVVLMLAAAACGSAVDQPATSPSTPATSADSSNPTSETVTACSLFSQADAESVIAADLTANEFNDEYDCTYFASEDPTIAATVTLRPFAATAQDIADLHAVFAEGTLEDIAAIGEAAVYYHDGAVHSLQFVQSGSYVTVIVTGVPDGDDVRAAETAIAMLIAAKL